jgi:hypothetical protein
VRNGDVMQIDEDHLSAHRARTRADAIRAELMTQGWTAV